MSGEFNGLGLAVGTVRGARSFRVDALGRLTGIHYEQVWRPGENVATCAPNPRDPYQAAVRAVAASFTKASLPVTVDKHEPKHDRSRCACGFYAFYDGSDDYGASTRVSAIVEGWGETVIGTRGFRAEKARILAICIPQSKAGSPGKRRRWPLTRWFVRHNAVSSAAGPAGTLLGLYGTAAGLIYGISSGAWWIDVLTGLWALLAGHVVASSFRAIDAKYDEPRSVTVTLSYNDEPPLTADLIAKVRRNYPDVPVFDSFKAMVADFPTDKGLEPSPESDPEFWERSA